jgi:long-chain acyl-CoA synthetase
MPGQEWDLMPLRNLAEVFRTQAERLGPRVALRHKRWGLYHDFTWEQYYRDALAVAAGLCAAGVQPGDRVGLVSENRLEWLIADMGILLAGAVNVPPHAPLSARQIQFQLADADVSWLFVSTECQLEKIRQIRPELPELRGVVAFDPAAAATDCASWRGFLQRGRAALPALQGELARREQALSGDAFATIIYTSGTTGNPKGVMLTHHNLLSNVHACDEMFRRHADTILLSWLPYSHIYARTVDHYLTIVTGVMLCLAESAETLVENLAETHPTNMSGVPRFYEKVLAAVTAADPATTGKRLRAVFGPRLEWLNSGGAPLPLAVARAYHDAGLLLLQGYGLTESSPVISFNTTHRYKLETVGLPLPGVEVKIAADGEVLTRGPHVMAGYWNNPPATVEAIRDGWLHTGDLGQLDTDGFLSITGRKKELMVLSNGKKIVPPQIESLLLADPCVDQVVVYGEGRNFLTALVVPHWAHLREAMHAAGLSGEGRSNEELAADPATIALLQRRVEAALRDVSGWEQVKKLIVLSRPFSVEAEELTVSLKLRRSEIFRHYGEQLEAAYRTK